MAGWCADGGTAIAPVRWGEVPDEGETGERTHVTHPANTNRQASIPRHGSLPCHPERSGTTHQKSSALTNHCRTANPAPSGAPAGGISLAKWHYIEHRTTFVRVPGWRNALHGTFKQRRSRLLAPRLGDGVRLRGVVWLCRSPLHPVCRFAQDDTESSRCAG